MSEDLLRERLVQCHQKDGPIYRVKPDYILADKMQIRRPVALIQIPVISVGIKAYPRDIVYQSIKPYIDDVLFIKGNRYAPCEGGPRYTQILQTGLQEVIDHFILPCRRLDKLGMILYILYKLWCIFAHLKEIRFLARRLHRPSAVGTFAVHQLGRGPE